MEKRQTRKEYGKRNNRSRGIRCRAFAVCFAAVGASFNAPFKMVFDKFNVVSNLVSAFKNTAQLGWSGSEVGAIWVSAVPSLILTIGILCVLINVIKSCFAIFGAVKPVKFARGAIVNLLCVLAIFVASLAGASAIGIEQIDFINDFIHGYASSELFTLVVFGAAYVVLCTVSAIINRDKCGYLK